jgi:aminoglycoside phosphotransferase (APT) family kinase protein
MSTGTSPMESVISHDQLMQLLRHTFGTKVELISCKIGKQLKDYLVLLAQLRYPSIEVVIKLAGREASLASTFDRTAALHRLVAAHTTISMPEVLSVNMSYQTWPWRYFIRTHIPGLEWAVVRPQMNADELSIAYHQLGDVVGQLHAIHFPLFGEPAVDGIVGDEETYLAALTKHARLSIKHAHLRELFCSVLEEQRHLFLDILQASLCHEDLHKYNILFQFRQGKWHLATILDFDKAWAGHCETDLARLELWESGMSVAFWRSYEEICPVEPLYEQRRAIYQLLWCLEYAQPTARHLADTNRLCLQLGLPSIERFD